MVAEEKQTSMETKNQLLYLPNDLIIQILLRLPVKFLIRFKCICKSWYSIISDTHFTNSHFELNAATQPHRAFFISYPRSVDLDDTISTSSRSIDLEASLDDDNASVSLNPSMDDTVSTVSPPQTRSIDLEASLDDDTASVSLNPVNFIPSKHYPRIEIKGSCRGFILFLCPSTFYLCNPSTGLHKNIPLSPLSFNVDELSDDFYGFGYDQSTDDYLMVLMLSGTNSSYVEFFSLRANTWKQIDEGTHIHYSYATEGSLEAGTLFNGAIHWFAYRHDLQKYVIVGFDLMKRKLLDIHLPDQFDVELDIFYSGLWVFREFLSLSAWNYDNDTVDIWVMKEYKVHSSWTKTHVLPTRGIPVANYFSPLCSTKSGDIVGTNGHSRLVRYNDEGHLLGLRPYYFNSSHGSHMVMYSESLLSLPGDNVQA